MITFKLPAHLEHLESGFTEALKTVIDPELNVNIVDLGLVYALKLDETGRFIVVEMTLSSKFCPMGESILLAVKNCMGRNFPDYTTDVMLVWEPQWSYTCISEEGIKILKGY